MQKKLILLEEEDPVKYEEEEEKKEKGNKWLGLEKMHAANSVVLGYTRVRILILRIDLSTNSFPLCASTVITLRPLSPATPPHQNLTSGRFIPSFHHQLSLFSLDWAPRSLASPPNVITANFDSVSTTCFHNYPKLDFNVDPVCFRVGFMIVLGLTQTSNILKQIT
ncbi:hypothetical protein PIB30_020899 [Stylosanthes scabra]|uniref:Uncharacterized protein n=1 Tax=Stylosanthes scabra TaxID=79078 RepID=A0ABU6Y918_9FABA|nr:hypothetical protein [Stylosanthes scabra]